MTGAVSTGRKIAGTAAQGMKYVTMELGGKSPLLILPDCDLETAVDGAMMASKCFCFFFLSTYSEDSLLKWLDFFSSGQVCTNGTRVFVPESMKDAFERLLVQKTRNNVRMGDPMHSSTNFGPLVNKTHLSKVRGFIEHGKHTDRATVLYDGASAGQRIDGMAATDLTEGYWCAPVIFTDCTDDMRICTEEIFGPVLCILAYDDSKPDYIERLVARANNTSLGLAAGIFTRDLNLAHTVVAHLQAGITWINTWGESPAEMSVGGWKMSGVGVENGRKALDHWVQNKSTLVDMAGCVVTAFAAPAMRPKL